MVEAWNLLKKDAEALLPTFPLIMKLLPSKFMRHPFPTHLLTSQASCSSVCVLVTQLCLILFNPIVCSPPGYFIHGILQARILEWAAISFAGDLLHPGIEPGTATLPSVTWEAQVILVNHFLCITLPLAEFFLHWDIKVYGAEALQSPRNNTPVSLPIWP